MAKRMCPYNQIIQTLQELKKQFPLYTMGQHFSTALADYGDVWGLTDNEFLFALEKYKTELEYNMVPETDVDKVIADAQDLYHLLDDKGDGEETEDGY